VFLVNPLPTYLPTILFVVVIVWNIFFVGFGKFCKSGFRRISEPPNVLFLVSDFSKLSSCCCCLVVCLFVVVFVRSGVFLFF